MARSFDLFPAIFSPSHRIFFSLTLFRCDKSNPMSLPLNASLFPSEIQSAVGLVYKSLSAAE